MNKEIVVILGMHRSGTSLLTKGIAEMGYFVNNSMPISEGNKKGYFEDNEIVNLNDKILDALSIKWRTVDITYINRCKTFLPILEEEFFNEAVDVLKKYYEKNIKCVLKDPRISILMPFWEKVFNYLDIKYKYILSVRNPKEVSKSLVARGNCSYEYGLNLWLYYNVLILKNLEKDIKIVHYENLIQNPKKVLNDLCEYLKVDKDLVKENIDRYANEFVEKDLRHQLENEYIDDNYIFTLYKLLSSEDIKINMIDKYLYENENIINSNINKELMPIKVQNFQIFIDNGDGLSEQNTIKFHLEDKFEHELNVSFRKNEKIKNLRIDPENEECIFILKDIINTKTLFSYIVNDTNAIYSNNNIYLLPNDGQIYLNNINEDIEEITIRYLILPYDKATSILTNQLKLKKQLISFANEFAEFEEKAKIEIDNKEQNIKILKSSLKDKEQNIEELKKNLEHKEQNIETLKVNAEDKERNIEILKDNLKDKEQNIETLKDNLKDKELYIKNVQNINDELKVKNKLILNLQNDIVQTQDIAAQNTRLLTDAYRNKEERKYVLKWPFRIAKKTLGFFVHPNATIKYYSNKKFLKEIGIFDIDFYVNNSNNYKIHKFNAFEHFIRYGYKEGYLPNQFYEHNAKEYFFNDGYNKDREIYKTLKKSKFFNRRFYLSSNNDLPKDINAEWHYMKYGFLEGRSPSKIFNTEYYLSNYNDINEIGVNPLYHYLEHGYYERRLPNQEYEYKGIKDKYKIIRYRLRKTNFKFSSHNIFSYLKKNGIKNSYNKFNQVIKGQSFSIKPYTYVQPEKTDEVVNLIENFVVKPKISIIIPVYNVEPKWIDLAIKSIENQWYENWEICIVDDCSTNKDTKKYLAKLDNEKIKVKFLEKNIHISGASNEALNMCTGDYVGLMDNDDEITVDALYEVVKKINEGYTFIYSDEDKLDMKGEFCEPHFKADFSPDLIYSQNYISHLCVMKKAYLDKVEGFTVGLEGSQDYDLYLKIFDMCKDDIKIAHIPKVLYHWRKIPGSTASEFSEKSYAQDRGRMAVENSIKRNNIDAAVANGKYPGTYRVAYNVKNNPLVSIVIPFKDAKKLLTMCVESILDKSTYENFEIVGISNNSEKGETFEEMKRLEELDSRIKFYEYNVPFNYSDINNYAINNHVKGDYVVLLNNDIEIISENWIEEMLGFAQRENTGAVGAMLYYPNDTIQHAGVIIGLGGVAGHSHKHFVRLSTGYFYRLKLIQNLSAVTAACLMVSTEKFKEINGLNDENLKIAFNDVDFCLRLREKGYLNVFTPYVEAYHHESISRGAEDSPEKIARFNSEIDYMKNRHKDILKEGDPYYNVNLTLDREDFGLR